MNYFSIITAIISLGCFVAHHLLLSNHAFYKPLFLLALTFGVIAVLIDFAHSWMNKDNMLSLVSWILSGIYWFAPFLGGLGLSIGIPALVSLLMLFLAARNRL